MRLVCASCGELFETDRSPIDALEEFQRDYPNAKVEDAAIVCHDCYLIITAPPITLECMECGEDVEVPGPVAAQFEDPEELSALCRVCATAISPTKH